MDASQPSPDGGKEFVKPLSEPVELTERPKLLLSPASLPFLSGTGSLPCEKPPRPHDFALLGLGLLFVGLSVVAVLAEVEFGAVVAGAFTVGMMGVIYGGFRAAAAMSKPGKTKRADSILPANADMRDIDVGWTKVAVLYSTEFDRGVVL